MQCLDENALLELAEGRLSVGSHAELEQHLDSCEACRRLVADVMRETAPQPEAPAGPLSLAPVDPALYPGTREVSRGGMGRIRLAVDRRLGRQVAIKEMLPGRGDRRRFEREARLTARLEHPSIVKVHEAGRWPDGEPFYVMPFVPGRSLDQVITRAGTLEERVALVPHVLAVADAVSSAHALRIIHRDLKPANVLVGEYGETVVIDWGLAKDLGAPDEPALLAEEGPGADAQTGVGKVLGTPAYMPPEQALGQPVDERADVYALGAILDHLLAGKPAFGGAAADSALEQVKRGPPPPLSTRAPRAPRELVTIAERAMARDPAARYPTAKEFAADLRRFQTGQLVGAHRYSPRQLLVRWVRRHRAAVGVAAVSLLVLLSFGGLALARVISAQQRAERSRANAEGLIDFILVDLHAKLLPLGRLDLLGDVARRVIASYAQRAEPLTAEEQGRLARSRRQLGDVLLAEGRTEEALTEQRAALALATAAARREPLNAAWLEERAAAYEGLGEVLTNRGDREGAASALTSALGLREQLAAQAPTNVGLQVALAQGRERLGRFFHLRGRAAEAEREYRAAVALLERLAPAHPDSQPVQLALASARAQVGNLLIQGGESVESLALYQSSIAVLNRLLAVEPANVHLLHELAADQQVLGDIHLERGELPEAGAAYERSRVGLQRLVAQDPLNANWQAELAATWDGVGDVLVARDDPTGALAAYRTSLSIRTRLAEVDPAHLTGQRSLSVSHEKLGRVLEGNDDRPGALAEYRAALALREEMLALDPRNAEVARDVMVAQLDVASMLVARGEQAEALRLTDAAVAFAQRELAANPDDTLSSLDVAAARVGRGEVLQRQGDPAAALAEFEQSVALVEKVRAEDWALVQEELAVAYEHQASALSAMGERPAARAALGRALEVLRALAERRPEDARLRGKVEALRQRLGALPAPR